MEVIRDIEISSSDSVESLKDFECGVPAMDKFIHDGLQQSLEHHYCRLYTATANGVIIAMFALSFDSVDLDIDDKEEIATGISTTGTPDLSYDYESTFYSKKRYPALDIAYFAVRKEYRNRHIGQRILSAIKDMAKNQKVGGCQFLSVEAYNVPGYSAVPFYDKCGFAPNELPNPNKDTLRMFYTLYSKDE